MPTGTLDIVRANFGRRTEIQGELRSIDEAATADTRAYTDEETAQIETLRSELESIDSRIQANIESELRSREIEDGIGGLLGVIADRETGEVEDTRSIGERFTDDDYRSWVEAGGHGKHHLDLRGMDFRAVTDVGTGATSAGALTRPERLSRVGQDFFDRKVYLLDLLPHIPVTQGSVEYVQDQTPLADMADKAVETAEGAVKPQAGPTFGVVEEPTATIPVWVNIMRQALADIPQIQGYLDSRLRYSLKRRSDKQAINGDGNSPNLRGLAQRSGILTYAPGSAEARYKSVRHGIRLMEDAEAVPEIVVLNPADAEIFDLSNHDADGLHAVPNVAGPGARTTWGLRQVRSTAIASGTALLIDPMATAVFDRQTATAYMTDSHASNFTSNILTLLLECRLALGLFDPKGVLKLTFNGTV